MERLTGIEGMTPDGEDESMAHFISNDWRSTEWLRRSALAMTLATVLLLGARAALAEDEVNATNGITAAGAPLALHGYDPVAYFTQGAPTPGNADHVAVHEGAAYYFASAENQKAFERDPARFSPAFGGFCAYGVSVGKKFDGDPRYWTVHEDRLYLNLNAEIARKFAADVPGSVAGAQKQWRKIRHAAIGDL